MAARGGLFGTTGGDSWRWVRLDLLTRPAAAVVVTTAVFGAYHLLDRWDWRPVIGATAAGLALGLIYLWQPQPPSLLTVTLVHGTITCGFLSLGPYVIYRWRLARQSLQISPEVVRK